MKKTTLAIILLLTFIFQSFSQINPVTNVTFQQSYQNMYNYFELNWDEPAQPHNELIGYNIYRENEFYKFQTENTLYYLYSVVNQGPATNDDEGFLLYEGTSGPAFVGHITAVYNPGQIESTFIETFNCAGFALNNKHFENQKAIVYPNPTNGIVNIGNKNLNKIIIYDITGNKIKEWKSDAQIDLSNFSKGVYILKLFSNNGILLDKVIVK
jgi:hypothetical protein